MSNDYSSLAPRCYGPIADVVIQNHRHPVSKRRLQTEIYSPSCLRIIVDHMHGIVIPPFQIDTHQWQTISSSYCDQRNRVEGIVVDLADNLTHFMAFCL